MKTLRRLFLVVVLRGFSPSRVLALEHIRRWGPEGLSWLDRREMRNAGVTPNKITGR